MTDQPSLFDDATPAPAPQAHARRSDPHTSHEAARGATPGLHTNQAAVLECLTWYGPMHDQLLIAAYRTAGRWAYQSDSGIRTRRSELVDQNKAHYTGRDEAVTTGRRTTHHKVWAAGPPTHAVREEAR